MKMNLINKKDRPREKIIKNGAFNLTDSELLAIMLGCGTKEESILDLSARLINEYGLKGMFNMSYLDLIKIPGIKEAKATKLLATFEIARRAMKNNNNNEIILNEAKDVFNYIKEKYILLNYELLTVIYVSNSLKIISKDKYSNIDSGLVEIPFKDIVYNAINHKAKGIFVIHNHPGGSLRPSISDIKGTKDLIASLKPLGIHLFDSIIINNTDYFSISDFINNNPLNNLKINKK